MMEAERRQDPTDGGWYTMEEFLACYGDTAAWDGAKAPLPQRARGPRLRPPSPRGPVEEERRIDPSDGGIYTRAEFEACYGGSVEWEQALPLGKDHGGKELRLDPSDHLPYAVEEFLKEYGGLEEWQSAPFHSYMLPQPPPPPPVPGSVGRDAAGSLPSHGSMPGSSAGHPSPLVEFQPAPGPPPPMRMQQVSTRVPEVERALKVKGDSLVFSMHDKGLTDEKGERLLEGLAAAVSDCIEDQHEALTIHLEGNKLGAKSVSALCSALQEIRDTHGLVVDKLMLHHNRINDDGCATLGSDFIKAQGAWCKKKGVPILPWEVHLSHNRIHSKGALALVASTKGIWPAQRRGEGSKVPLWLRLERNLISGEPTWEVPVVTVEPPSAGGAHPVYHAAKQAPDACVYMPFITSQKNTEEEVKSRMRRVMWRVVSRQGTCLRYRPEWASREGKMVQEGSTGIVDREEGGFILDARTEQWIPKKARDGTTLVEVVTVQPGKAPKVTPVQLSYLDLLERRFWVEKGNLELILPSAREEEVGIVKQGRVVFNSLVVSSRGAVLTGRLHSPTFPASTVPAVAVIAGPKPKPPARSLDPSIARIVLDAGKKWVSGVEKGPRPPGGEKVAVVEVQVELAVVREREV
eukprot:Hpha_TRINITY_DN16386_c3_g19::TRINITY_DN16386_c3_g19_i1::g.62699::m.62699